jgi:hypothetical protein
MKAPPHDGEPSHPTLRASCSSSERENFEQPLVSKVHDFTRAAQPNLRTAKSLCFERLRISLGRSIQRENFEPLCLERARLRSGRSAEPENIEKPLL